MTTSYSRKFDSAAKEALASGEKIFLREPDLDFLLVVC